MVFVSGHALIARVYHDSLAMMQFQALPNKAALYDYDISRRAVGFRTIFGL